MNKLKLVLISLLMLFTSFAFADTYVNGYTKSNGTYVAPHYRSSPDSSYNNNWSVQGNQNPYTGAYGTKPRTLNDSAPQYNTNTYGNTYDSGNLSGTGY